MKKQWLILLLIALNFSIFFNFQSGWAWNRDQHELAARISYRYIPANSRSLFDLNGLLLGVADPDIMRDKKWFNPFINQSHKKDTWRITASYNAGLKVTNNPNLSSRYVGRSFHYIMDQSEGTDNLRNRIQRATGINTRDLGFEVLKEIEAGKNTIFNLNYRRLYETTPIKNMRDVEKEVQKYRDEFNRRVGNVLSNRRPQVEAYRILKEFFSYYFTYVIMLQNKVLYGYSIEASRKQQPPPAEYASQAEKDALIREINGVYSTRWLKQWCEPKSWSGCAIVPAGAKDGLIWRVVNASKRNHLTAIRNTLYCMDPCIMGKFDDRQRAACSKNCADRFPY